MGLLPAPIGCLFRLALRPPVVSFCPVFFLLNVVILYRNLFWHNSLYFLPLRDVGRASTSLSDSVMGCFKSDTSLQTWYPFSPPVLISFWAGSAHGLEESEPVVDRVLGSGFTWRLVLSRYKSSRERGLASDVFHLWACYKNTFPWALGTSFGNRAECPRKRSSPFLTYTDRRSFQNRHALCGLGPKQCQKVSEPWLNAYPYDLCVS